MVLYIVGLGLGNEKDITLRGLEAVQSCSKVFLENYTSILANVSVERLSEFYGREVILADRDCVESNAESIYMDAVTENIAFLVVGDPFW
jgi:diphthine synthase